MQISRTGPERGAGNTGLPKARSLARRQTRRPALIAMAAAVASGVAGACQAQYIGANYSGSAESQSGFYPPDTDGAVGTNYFVELLNGRFAVHNKVGGAVVQSKSLDQFFIDGGATPTGFSFDPRILYNPASGRWFASAVDNAEGTSNSFLLAVSATSDPTQGWTAFKFASDSVGNRWADFPTLGLNADGVFLSANLFTPGASGTFSNVNVMILPKQDLIGPGVPTVANRVLRTNVNSTTGFAAQPVVSLDNAPLPETLLSGETNNRVRASSISGPVSAPTVGGTANKTLASNPGAAAAAPQPGTSVTLDTGDGRFGGSVVEQGGVVWATQAINSGGRAAIRWMRLNASTHAVLESGIISNPSLFLFEPSLAVNASGDVVIGMTASSSSQNPSTYAVVGHVAGTTTFGSLIQTSSGPSAFTQAPNSFNTSRWGDYSATTLDPTDPGIFWTIQEFAAGTSNWQTQITEIIVPHAGEARWSNTTTGTFADSANWYGGAVASATSHAIFSLATAYSVNLGADASIGQMTVRQGDLTLNLGGHTLSVGTNLTVAELPGSTARVTITGGSAAIGGSEYVGYGGLGILLHLDGSNSATSLFLGYSNTASGTYGLSGGTAAFTNVYVGGSSSGTGGLGSLNMSGGTLTVAGTLKVWNSGASAINLSGGSLTAGNTVNNGTLAQTGGISSLGPLSGTGSTTVGGGTSAATMTVASFAQNSVTINTGGTFHVATNATPVTNSAANLQINGNGTLDLANHALVVNNTLTPASTIRNYLIAGYNAGAWNGPGGITSTTVAGSPNTLAIGYADNRGAGSNQVLIVPTVIGDATLEGTVDLADFGRLSTNFGATAGASWDQGDFNYDGGVDLSDFGKLSANFGTTVPVGGGGFGGAGGGASAASHSSTSGANRAAVTLASAAVTLTGKAASSAAPASGPGIGQAELDVDTVTGNMKLIFNQVTTRGYEIKSSLSRMNSDPNNLFDLTDSLQSFSATNNASQTSNKRFGELARADNDLAENMPSGYRTVLNGTFDLGALEHSTGTGEPFRTGGPVNNLVFTFLDAAGNIQNGSVVYLPVPEPTSLALLGLGAAGLLGRRRRRTTQRTARA